MKERLVQTRLPAAVADEIQRQADEEGISMAAFIRRALMELSRPSHRTTESRLRALEVAAVNFGIVPEGVVQPLSGEDPQ